MQIYNSAVIAYFMICKEQIGKILAPLSIDFICCEILLQLIIEYLMRFSMLISRLFWMNNRTETKLCVHIFMNGGITVRITFTLQIDFHTPIAVNSIVRMIYFLNLCLDFGFKGIIIRLPVFPVVVISIWAYTQPSKQPANAKFKFIVMIQQLLLHGKKNSTRKKKIIYRNHRTF